MKKKLPLIIVLCVVGLALLGGGIFAIVKLTGEKPFQVENRDVKKYFEERAEIISVTPVKKSKNTLAEKDVVEALKARGFTQYAITTNYTYDGKYGDAAAVDGGSASKHPKYETYYVTTKKELWVITVIDGIITAYPSSYNNAHPENVPILVSETKEIASYDNTTNSIYLTIPKAEAADVRIVDQIDAKTIESMKLGGQANDAE